MTKYHITERGEAGLCRATVGTCPYGDSERHYPTPEDARVAYEVSQMASTMPEAMQVEDLTRRKLGMLAPDSPAMTGVAPVNALDKLDTLRTQGRTVYESVVGGRTYAVNRYNEKMGDEGAIHLLEADSPYGERQWVAFRQFVEQYGLEYEVRKTRVSLFKSPASASPSREDILSQQEERYRSLKAQNLTMSEAGVRKDLKRVEARLAKLPDPQDMEYKRIARERDEYAARLILVLEEVNPEESLRLRQDYLSA